MAAEDSAGGGLEVPCAWGDLLVLERLGSGGYADVYLAREKALNRPVALKIYRTRPGENGRPATRAPGNVLNEAILMARVNDPNVVRVYGARRFGRTVGMWMELVKGWTLESMLQAQGAFGEEEARLIGRKVCAALVAVHNAGLLHRDVKASNIMREEGGRILLMDFGVGAQMREDGGVRGLSGTPAYMAPEVARDGISTVASDIYSLGVLLSHLVTGCYPGDPARTTIHAARRRRRPEPSAPIEDYRPDLPADLVAVIEKAMDPDPRGRFGTAGAMLHALDSSARPERNTRAAEAAKIFGSTGRRQGRAHPASRGRRPSLERMFDSLVRVLLVLLGLWLVAWMLQRIFHLLISH